MKKMKIGLMGFEFQSANKGCEALVYSFLAVLTRFLNENDIVCNFSGTELGNIPLYFDKIKFENVPPKIKDLKCTYIRKLKQCDIVFDVPMGDSFSDIYSESYYYNLIKHKKLAELFVRKYVLLPQTYGPFLNKKAERVAKTVLSKAYKIYCRDSISKELLEKFGISDSVLTSDMAFTLPYKKEMFQLSSNKKIGLNVSGLLFKGGFNSDNQFGLSLDYRELIDKILKTFATQKEIHLIPHVIDLKDDAYDDDYKICKLIHDEYPNTILAPAFETPIQAKSYISNMDIFIGSRMHSTIASFSAGVITIPISYSRKFEGLFNSLNYPFVINARTESTDSAFESLVRFIDEKEKLAESQNNALKLIQKEGCYFAKSIESLVKELYI